MKCPFINLFKEEKILKSLFKKKIYHYEIVSRKNDTIIKLN